MILIFIFPNFFQTPESNDIFMECSHWNYIHHVLYRQKLWSKWSNYIKHLLMFLHHLNGFTESSWTAGVFSTWRPWWTQRSSRGARQRALRNDWKVVLGSQISLPGFSSRSKLGQPLKGASSFQRCLVFPLSHAAMNVEMADHLSFNKVGLKHFDEAERAQISQQVRFHTVSSWIKAPLCPLISLNYSSLFMLCQGSCTHSYAKPSVTDFH